MSIALGQVWCLLLGATAISQGLGLVLIKDQEATTLCGRETYKRVGIFILLSTYNNNVLVNALATWKSLITACGKSVLIIHYLA